MLEIGKITSYLESLAPLSLQESYDNSGLQVGSKDTLIDKALIALDVTEEVVQEAIDHKCGLIISHHPVIFGGLKRLNGNSMAERVIMTALKNDIALYAIHTNLDNIKEGVNKKIADKLGLQNVSILEPKKGLLKKLVTYCPEMHDENGLSAVEKVKNTLFDAGAGKIGNYDQCSYNLKGIGTFRPNEGAHPTLGTLNKQEKVEETRIEVIFPEYLERKILETLFQNHPYEEVAYDLYRLENEHQYIGSGMIGELSEAMEEIDFLHYVKEKMQSKMIRHTPVINKKIKKVALCGGSGSFLLKTAMRQNADAFVTGDFKYHQFFDAEGKILIADIGHYESEQFTVELLYEILRKKFTNFALLNSRVITNPVNYI